MASACKFFDEDAVYRINKKKYVDVGLVLENSEFISSDEEQSDDPDYHGWERMKKGHVRVAWYPNGAEEVLPERKVNYPIIFHLFLFLLKYFYVILKYKVYLNCLIQEKIIYVICLSIYGTCFPSLICFDLAQSAP